jgi:3-deoxy-manno-octulosonate cytidylyltransferase (CMP-KDO synthetase)
LKIIIVIPARYKSTRFPGKPLKKLLGKPLLQWVAELSAKVLGKKNVYIATDDIRIFKFVKKLNFKPILTSKNCLTGTDRLSEVASKIKADIYVNVQGDEPLIDFKDIKKIIKAKKKYPNDIINGYTIIDKNENPKNVNIPKVIFTKDKRLIYISRSLIPGSKDMRNNPKIYHKQVCIYAFNRKELLNFGKYKRKSNLEKFEDIEILRFIEFGKVIRLVKTTPGSLAVDEPKDIKKVEISLKKTLEKSKNTYVS